MDSRRTGTTGRYRIDLVVFDMAGTTVADDGRVLDAFVRAAGRNRLPVEPGEVNAMMGMSKEEVFARLAGRMPGASRASVAALIDECYFSFRRGLESSYRQDRATEIPGTAETFRWLRERGVRVALTTGFYASVRDLILEQLAWTAGIVDAALCAGDVPLGRPAPYMTHLAMQRTGVVDVHRVARVGDTPMDCLDGYNSGAGVVVAVLTGGRPPEAFRGVYHTHILESVADLPALFDREFREGSAA